MAKSPTELIRDLEKVVVALQQQLDHVGEKVEDGRPVHRDVERGLADVRQEVAILRQRLDDHLKRVEEWDRRRWMLYGLLIGAILSFVANLVVALVRK